jgi:hypothetical protein
MTTIHIEIKREMRKISRAKGVRIHREKMRAGQPDAPLASRVCFIAYDSR